MTEILCRWLNDEVKLTRKVDAVSFARDFSTGYLIGEVLNRYQLQNDFDQFSQSRTSDSKLNNFTRLEPVFHLLEIPFDTNVARDLMTEKHGTATRLMYQVFIALNKKDKANLTGTAMETMRPAGPVKLEAIESQIYKESASGSSSRSSSGSGDKRLKHMTPRQTDLNLEALVHKFHEKQIQLEKTAFKQRFEEQERLYQSQQDQRQELLNKSKKAKAQQTEMLAKIQAATVHIPKPPPNRTMKAISQRREMRKQKEAEATCEQLALFEEKLKAVIPVTKKSSEEELSDLLLQDFGSGLKEEEMTGTDPLAYVKPTSNDDYIGKIRKRLQEDSKARTEREKRRRKVLVDQMKAHEAQEEARREEMLVNRLMRQSQQERRIAVQLMQARHEKEIIRRNRILREKQYEERRMKDFEDSLNKEAEMARLARLEYIAQTKQDRELHDKIATERKEARYRKHYNICQEVLCDIVDFAAKVGEYRELTDKQLPPKLMREWTDLFVSGHPLYTERLEALPAEPEGPTPAQIIEEERQQLLDEGDFAEYKNMIGEWMIPDGSDIPGVPPDNPILGHIIQRLFDIVHPPSPPPPPPEFPPFPIKVCVVGKVFSGKTSCIERLVKEHRLEKLNTEELVSAAIAAHKDGEVLEITQEELEPGSVPATAETGKESSMTAAGTTPGVDARSSVQTGVVSSEPDNKTVEEAMEKKDDGTEKGDPEKPVDMKSEPPPSSKASRRTKSRPPPKPQPSPRAKLGSKALKSLKKGKPVDDQLTVDILVEAIRRVPEGTGWVLDGFPTNFTQARMLEKALSGYDGSLATEKTKENLEKKSKKKSTLAPDPRPQPPPAEPGSGIDVVVLFDVNNELCLKRSAGRTMDLQNEQKYQLEFKPPPDGSMTGIGKQERVVTVVDEAHDQEQIQHRITAFQDAWPKMEKWFSKFGTLLKVDAAQSEETTYYEVEHILESTLAKLQGKDKAEPAMTTESDKPEEKKTEKQADKQVDAKKTDEAQPDSKKGSRAGSAKSRGSSKGSQRGKSPKGSDKNKRDKSESPRRSKAGSRAGSESSGKKSRGSSPEKGSPKRGRSSSKKRKTPEPEPEPEPEAPPGTPPPQPGSEEWEYVDEHIEEDLCGTLVPIWETVEDTYINSSKFVFRKVREERENIYRYFHKIKKSFMFFLRRPDHKQEFVAAWQLEYNAIPDDMRDDEETCSEMHQRVDDLRETLWNICDERKDQAEQERSLIMLDGWLDDRLGILSNHYISLMQCEVDRFQDTVHMMKDYYRGMEGKIPDEMEQNFARIPLVELPPTEPPGSPDKSIPPTPAPPVEESPTPERPPEKKKSGTPSGRKKASKEKLSEDVSLPPMEPDVPEGERKRIPLVPRRPPASPEPTLTNPTPGKDKKEKGKGKKDKKGGSDAPMANDESVESPQPPMDPDDKLVFDAYMTAIGALEKIIAAEQAAREAEEEAEREKEREREREKEKQQQAQKKTKKKGGKASRSPSPKKAGKGAKEPEPEPTPPPQEEESEEEKKRKEIKERMRLEYFEAINKEETAAKVRLELIKLHAMSVLADLKNKADTVYKDMMDWLGARFLKEMESIDHMSEIQRNAIETRTHIKNEVVLIQEDFMINEAVLLFEHKEEDVTWDPADMKVARTPSPTLEPPPTEEPMPDQFTVKQLLNIYNMVVQLHASSQNTEELPEEFMLTAPTGVMSLKGFVDTFQDLTSLSHGLELLPDIWMNITSATLQMMADQLSPDGEYVDWRTFILAVAHPWPVPTQTDLLNTLSKYHDMDQKITGFVTREQYDRVDLWFSPDSKPTTPTDQATKAMAFSRLDNLKRAFFDVFAESGTDPPRLDYVNMLIYFSVTPDPYEGFLRALSVASGTHMPRVPRRQERRGSQGSLAASMAGSEKVAELEVPESPLPEDVPPEAINAKVPLEALVRVLHHGQSVRGDSHRFSVTSDPEDAFSKQQRNHERLGGVYQELGTEDCPPILFTTLMEHPVIQDIVSQVNRYKSVDLKNILNSPPADNTDAQSMKTEV